MGNSQSSAASCHESHQPRRPVRSRLRRYTSAQPMDNYDFCVGLSESDAASQLAASFRSIKTSDARLSTLDTLPVPLSRADHTPSVYSRFSRRGSHSVGDDLGPSRLQLREQRAYSVYESAGTGTTLSTFEQPDGADESCLLHRTQSWHGLRSLRQGESPYGLQRRTGASGAVTPQSQAIEVHNLLQSYQMERLAQSERCPDFKPAQAPADAPSYARRRSMVLVPGVATRLEPDDIPSVPPLPNRAKSNSLRLTLAEQPVFKADAFSAYLRPPVTPARTSVDSDTGFVRPPLVRACTPNNLDYQQLGGHKFGTLKVMNASPDPVSTTAPPSEEPPKEDAQLGFADATGLGMAFLGGFSWEDESHLAGVRRSKSDCQEGTRERAQLRVMNESIEPDRATRRGSRSFSISLRRFSLHRAASLEPGGGSDDGTLSYLDMPCEPARKSLSKPDSGYGSQTSLRSLHDACQAQAQAQEPSKTLLPSVSLRGLSRRARTSSIPPVPDDVDSFVPTKPKKAHTQMMWKPSTKKESGSGSLRNKPSLTAMAEAAHAAFSLKMRHRRSTAGHGLQ